MSTTIQPHEFVSSMNRYQVLSGENLSHMKKIAGARKDFVVPRHCLQFDAGLNGELEAQIAPVSGLEAGSDEAANALNAETRERAFSLTRTALGQVGDPVKLGIRHFDHQFEAGRTRALADYLNTNFRHLSLADDPIVVRVLDGEPFAGETTSGRIRAVLSTRYQRFDAHDLMMHLIPRIASGELMLLAIHTQWHGETVRMTVADPAKAFQWQGETGTHGERLKEWPSDDQGLFLPGASISLSETGGGAVRIDPVLIKQACVNGAVIGLWGNRKIHVTRDRHTVGVAWQADTIESQRETGLRELRDMVNFCLSDNMVADFRKALSQSAATPVTIDALKPKLTAKLDKAGVGKEDIDKVMALFEAQFTVRKGASRYDAAQAINESRTYDNDPVVAPVLDDLAGELLVGKL